MKRQRLHRLSALAAKGRRAIGDSQGDIWNHYVSFFFRMIPAVPNLWQSASRNISI
jgi:hypothetical protein